MEKELWLLDYLSIKNDPFSISVKKIINNFKIIFYLKKKRNEKYCSRKKYFLITSICLFKIFGQFLIIISVYRYFINFFKVKFHYK